MIYLCDLRGYLKVPLVCGGIFRHVLPLAIIRLRRLVVLTKCLSDTVNHGSKSENMCSVRKQFADAVFIHIRLDHNIWDICGS